MGEGEQTQILTAGNHLIPRARQPQKMQSEEPSSWIHSMRDCLLVSRRLG
jgi:hypothetical protein